MVPSGIYIIGPDEGCNNFLILTANIEYIASVGILYTTNSLNSSGIKFTSNSPVSEFNAALNMSSLNAGTATSNINFLIVLPFASITSSTNIFKLLSLATTPLKN